MNDVWLSVDSGVSWTQQTSAAQWSPRSSHTSVVWYWVTILLLWVVIIMEASIYMVYFNDKGGWE